MPTYDCNGEATLTFDVMDRIEADSADEADRIFKEKFESGEYDDQFSGGGIRRDFLTYGAVED